MASTARAFALPARAKLNLRLEIGARAPSRLHLVRSVVSDLLVSDQLAFAPSEGFAVSCSDPALPERANLVWRAAQALDVRLPSVRIHVQKNLPTQAGLGGGSADAAAALRGIAEILRLDGHAVSEHELMAAAARIGSDVPACLIGGLKVVEGTGDIVRPLDAPAPPWGVLLLKPPVGVPTADAYDLLDHARSSVENRSSASDEPIRSLCDALVRRDFDRFRALVHNDFQSPIEAAYPAVRQARLRLAAAGARATVLCGSGACVAGLFETTAQARTASAQLSLGAGEWCAATGFANGR